MADEVYLHIGLPKTGTTYVQEILCSNADRAGKLAYGLAADTHLQHIRAALDLCQRRARPRIERAWERQAERIRRTPGRVVLSQEQLCRATADQAARALADVAPARTTVVITARDLARQITS